MQKIRKTAILILAILSMTVSVFAADIPEPQEIIRGQTEDLQTIEKVYVLPVNESVEVIPTDNFVENKTEFTFVEMKKQDNTQEDVKEHIETVSFPASTTNTEKVIAMFEPTMEISTEDGYIGTLEFDYTSLKVTAAGYGKQSYTITESRSYPNLADSDTSLVPKTITKDGATLNLTNISWQTAASENIDGHDLAVRYTAHASYSGTGTKTYTKGYTATAEYKGEVKKVTHDSIVYTAVFNEIPKEKGLLSYWWAYLLGLLGLGGAGYGTYRIIRKRRKEY